MAETKAEREIVVHAPGASHRAPSGTLPRFVMHAEMNRDGGRVRGGRARGRAPGVQVDLTCACACMYMYHVSEEYEHEQEET